MTIGQELQEQIDRVKKVLVRYESESDFDKNQTKWYRQTMKDDIEDAEQALENGRDSEWRQTALERLVQYE